MRNITDLNSLSDDDLLHRLSRLVGRSRRVTADLVAHIGEVDRRRLFAREATSSMFGYCTQVLHLSEHEAYLRIAVARAARKHPILLEMLRDGRLHLSAIEKIAALLDAADESLRDAAFWDDEGSSYESRRDRHLIRFSDHSCCGQAGHFLAEATYGSATLDRFREMGLLPPEESETAFSARSGKA